MPRHFSAATDTVIAASLRDHADWRRGRIDYAVWLIDAHDAPLRARLAMLRARLGDLWLPQRRAPHLTLHVCGFVAEHAVHDDDCPRAALAAQHAALQALAPPPFELTIGGLDSFDSAAFLAVDDAQHALPPLRAALDAVRPEIRFAPYVPHLTLGLYAQAWRKDEIRRRHAALPALPPLRLRVSALRLAGYDARDPDSPLRTLVRLPLHERTQAGAASP